MSLRSLARDAEVNPAHLSRVLRGRESKATSTDLARRVAEALDLPADYFPEYREGLLIERVKTDPALRDRLYRRHAAGDKKRAGR